MIPTANEAMIVVASRTGAAVGMPKPNASSRPLSSRASPTPATRPMAEATTPTMSASTMTDARIWPRDEPIARSSADSLIRWAMVIENVL